MKYTFCFCSGSAAWKSMRSEDGSLASMTPSGNIAPTTNVNNDSFGILTNKTNERVASIACFNYDNQIMSHLTRKNYDISHIIVLSKEGNGLCLALQNGVGLVYRTLTSCETKFKEKERDGTDWTTLKCLDVPSVSVTLEPKDNNITMTTHDVQKLLLMINGIDCIEKFTLKKDNSKQTSSSLRLCLLQKNSGDIYIVTIVSFNGVMEGYHLQKWGTVMPLKSSS